MKRFKGKTLSPAFDKKKGYFFVNLSKHNRQHNRCLHQIVGPAFLGKRPTPNHEINHKDGDKSNNHWSKPGMGDAGPEHQTRCPYRPPQHERGETP